MQTSNSFFKTGRKPLAYILISALSLLGTAASTACFCAYSEFFKEQLLQIFCSYFGVDTLNSLSSVQIFLISFLWGTFFNAVCLLLGFFTLSQPILLTLPIIEGAALGLVVCNVYAQFNYQGIPISAVCLVLPAVIGIAVLTNAVCESLSLSLALFNVLFSERSFSGFKKTVGHYFVKFALCELLIIINATVCVLCAIFYRLLF